jgi:Na+-transporting methylmalonyl-CoA/oxaloacetate decarboxylase gamma subunit
MTDALYTAFTVSGIAIIVIFLVLTILIFTIKLLVHLLPYEAPPPQVKKARPVAAAPVTQTSDVDADIAAITSVMASHLGQTAGNLQVINIQSR